MPDRSRLMHALEVLPDEALSWLVLNISTGRIWPDMLGGFQADSKAAITEVRAAAAAYVVEVQTPPVPQT